MEAAKFDVAQEVFAERAEVGAIAEAPGRDADELPAGNEQPLDECNEARVEVARFDTDGTKCASLGGVGADFAIGWIRDGGIEGGRR